MLTLVRWCRRRLVVFILLLGAAGVWMAPGRAAAEEGRTSGQTIYVPVYSHIFFGDRGTAFNLAATLSIRNADPAHSLTVTAADYYDSSGRLLKKHFDKPFVLKPLAATEIFTPESDTSGGFGASFIVRWKSAKPVAPPVVECLMIGARSGQGISIVSPGRVIPEVSP